MQDLNHLRSIRLEELKVAARFLPAGGRLLELGAGAGWQAEALASAGFEVTALETSRNHYPGHDAFPITEYDGYSIPFPDSSFDAVFSSNVLEHVEYLPRLLRDSHRVLRNDGIAVHLMPSPAWRLWSNLVHPAWFVQRGSRVVLQALRSRKGTHPGTAPLTPAAVRRGIADYLLPKRHGERGNAWSEVYYLSPRFWRQVFREAGFELLHVVPAGVFYTTAGVFGHHLGTDARKRASRLAGSSCMVYVVKKLLVSDEPKVHQHL